jgi:DNA polymerase III alpha subunit (gram-positive type)
MLVVFKGIKQKNVLVFDAEYNEGDLIQFSGIMFKQVEEDIFQISKSLNIYVKLPLGYSVNRFIQQFTGISNEFLEEFGLEIDQALLEIKSLVNVTHDLIFVSHGLYNDRQTLSNNGVDFYTLDKKDGPQYPGICTYNLAKKVLKRETKLKLAEVASDAGLFLSNDHNAFDDTWATVAILSFLCKLNYEQEEK